MMSVFGAASDQPAVAEVTLPEIGTCSHSVFNTLILPLSPVAKVAVLAETADAAEMDLKDIKLQTLIQCMIDYIRDGKLYDFLAEKYIIGDCTIALQTDIINFINRCRAAMTTVPADQKNKIFLAECVEDLCPASRTKNPLVRSTFERMVADAIMPRHVGTFCAFASGSLLQELRMLEQWKEQGKKIGTIVIIDRIYRRLTDVLSKSQEDELYLASTQKMHELVSYVKLKEEGYPFIDIVRIAARVSIIQQFADQVASLYPESFKGIRVYADATDYINACKKFHEKRADVLVTCDIKHKDFLKQNPEWVEAWLDYHLLEGNCLQISAVSALLSIGGGAAQNPVFMRVKGTTGMASKYTVFDSKGLREVTQQEHDELTEIGKEFRFVLPN